MWPFRKKEKVQYLDPQQLNYTQVDITERFDDHLSLTRDEWIETIPLNTLVEGNRGNLPTLDATTDEVYQIASELSQIRESFRRPDDGVYCPICHIANIDVAYLRMPCPKCQRPLLAFGWT